MEPPWEVGKKVYIIGTCHMTKMAAMLIYRKISKIFFYRINSRMIMKLCMEQYVLKRYKIYINDDRELNLTYFKTMSRLAELVFVLTVGQISGERLQDHWPSGFQKLVLGE